MGEIHSRGFAAALSANNRDHAGIARSAEEIAEMHKELHEWPVRLSFGDHQSYLALEARDIFDFVVDVEKIHSDDIAFDAARRSRAGPAHGVNVKLVTRGRKQLGLSGAARPTFPDGVFFEMDVFEPDRFHFGEAPFLGLMVAGGAGDASADVVGKLPEELEGARIHLRFAGDFRQRGESAVIGRPFRAIGPRYRCRRNYQQAHQYSV